MRAAVVPFQLTVGGRAGGGYAVRAVAAGRSAEAATELPPLVAEPEALGLALGQALFPPPVRQLLLDVARGADEAGARVQLQLQVSPPELAAFPWEWATLGRTSPWSPAIREDYTLVRSGRSGRPGPPLPLDSPVRLLIACAPGSAAAATPLGHSLAQAVSAGRLLADLLRDADPLTLRETLEAEPCHILHLVVDDATGSGAAARLRAGRTLDAIGLASIAEQCPELRLVTIAAAPGVEGEPLADVAAAIHQRLGVATVSLGQLSFEAAATFCGPCYTALALCDPFDLAVTDGRAALAEAAGPWGAPRAWLAPGAELLFEERAQRSARAAIPAYSQATRVASGALEPSLPVGTPIRSRRDEAPSRGATATNRPFVVEATGVGRPAQRVRPETASGNFSPRLLALALACLVLIGMVSRVLERPNTTTPAAATATAAALPTVAPTTAPRGNPLNISQPQGYTTYTVGPGDTLASIAARAGSTPQALAHANFLAPDTAVRQGRTLVVPLYGNGEPLPVAPIVERGNPQQPLVALTFDIEIDDTSLYTILDVLEAKDVRGTFFVTGSWVESYPAAAKAIVAAGHELGNHSLTHPAFSSIGVDGANNELAECERIVREVTGATTRPYFRFPYGDSTPALVTAVAQRGYAAYHWSADDYGIPSWLAQAAANPTQAYGGILLMHGRPATAESLGGYIDQLVAMGLTPTTLGAVLE